MNSNEFKCVNILSNLVESYSLVGIKTSFEDEGATFNESIRLKQICNEANTKLTIKIGGPEAIRDIVDAVTIGIKGLVAPMVESPFALKKFINAIHTNVDKSSINTLNLGINIETIKAISDIENILNQDSTEQLSSITVGRVDLVSSMNKDRSFVNDIEIFNMIKKTFTLAKKFGLKLYVGGAISVDSETFLHNLFEEGLLDRFETRYAIYDSSALKNFSEALSQGQLFEYEWLKSKQIMYQHMCEKDNARIQMIKQRLEKN